MDMWRPYLSIIEDQIPGAVREQRQIPAATVIVDKWHVLRMGQRGHGTHPHELPGQSAARPSPLTPTERLILEGWINEFKPLGAAWKAKEALWDYSPHARKTNDSPATFSFATMQLGAAKRERERWTTRLRKLYSTPCTMLIPKGTFRTGIFSRSLSRTLFGRWRA